MLNVNATQAMLLYPANVITMSTDPRINSPKVRVGIPRGTPEVITSDAAQSCLDANIMGSVCHEVSIVLQLPLYCIVLQLPLYCIVLQLP